MRTSLQPRISNGPPQEKTLVPRKAPWFVVPHGVLTRARLGGNGHLEQPLHSCVFASPPGARGHLVRHGSNGPPKKDYIKFEDNLTVLRRKILRSRTNLKGKLCDKDLALIQRWKMSHMMSNSAMLTKEGEEEIATLAHRFKSVFPGLLKKGFTMRVKPGDGTKSAFSKGHYNQQSMVAYNKGMFGFYTKWVAVGGKPSAILQFSDNCGNYIERVINADKRRKPYHNFMNGSYMTSVLESVADRLGFAVSVSDVRVMYNACRYYYAWYPNKDSPWCSVFTPDNLKILEYWEDLRVYYDQGPVYEISSKQACKLGKEVMDQFRNQVEKGSAGLYLTRYIVYPEALVTFITLMGIFSEQERLDEFTIPDSRVWKTSEFAGFGGNLAILLSVCIDHSFWVSALINERPVQLQGCNSTLGCSWDDFSENNKHLNDCNLFKICGRTTRRLRRPHFWYDYYINENWM
ncbi:hypothetical protein C7M84_022565 [Penaeus vannamei]|uniref:Multiple inositol polyphosphate phosphatase 1 n=1 Tax=Penaeus vannamei TaxID=6689 RepID=A0A423U6B3_PENVA|nr:hypothetical protein C7M84_022565 [Penaeus vannamei]